jgi:uncharacterized repeat protein (TIGR01451 family)
MSSREVRDRAGMIGWRGGDAPRPAAPRWATAVRVRVPLPLLGMLLLLASVTVAPARAATTIIDSPVNGPITINAGDRVEIHTGGSVSSGGIAVTVNTGGELVILDGSILGGYGGFCGGVEVNGGTATLSGGKVSGDVGVHIRKQATISGGSISGQTAGVLIDGGYALIRGCNLHQVGTTLSGILEDGTVIDTTLIVYPPAAYDLYSDTAHITCPANQTVPATSAAGAVVNYPPPTISHNCGPVQVTCVPTSGSTFPVGTTPVTCTVTDLPSNSSSCNFTVTVLPAADLRLLMTAASGNNTGNPLKVNAKQSVTYTIVVANGGPSSAANVVVQDVLPTSFVFESASTTQGTLQSPPPGGTGTLTASLGTLASGAVPRCASPAPSVSARQPSRTPRASAPVLRIPTGSTTRRP